MKKIFIALIIIFSYGNVFAQYKRIISLAPSVTQSLYELGIDKEIVANTVYCPKGNFEKESIGTLTEPNIEKIIALRPDLIISTKEGNNKFAVEKMQRLNCQVYVMGTFSSFDDICKNFQDLADYLGKQDTANRIISDVKKEIDKIYNRTKFLEQKKVFWEVGAKPLFTAGGQSFINDYNKFAGGINIFKYIDMRYPNITLETVIEKNPEIIILVSMGDVGKEEIVKWKKYKTISAVKNGKIFILNAEDIFTPTPKTFLKGVQLTDKVLNKN